MKKILSLCLALLLILSLFVGCAQTPDVDTSGGTSDETTAESSAEDTDTSAQEQEAEPPEVEIRTLESLDSPRLQVRGKYTDAEFAALVEGVRTIDREKYCNVNVKYEFLALPDEDVVVQTQWTPVISDKEIPEKYTEFVERGWPVMVFSTGCAPADSFEVIIRDMVAFPHRVGTAADFEALTPGMSLYEVAARVGLPFREADVLGYYAYDFRAEDGSVYRLRWNPAVTSNMLAGRIADMVLVDVLLYDSPSGKSDPRPTELKEGMSHVDVSVLLEADGYGAVNSTYWAFRDKDGGNAAVMFDYTEEKGFFVAACGVGEHRELSADNLMGFPWNLTPLEAMEFAGPPLYYYCASSGMWENYLFRAAGGEIFSFRIENKSGGTFTSRFGAWTTSPYYFQPLNGDTPFDPSQSPYWGYLGGGVIHEREDVQPVYLQTQDRR